MSICLMRLVAKGIMDTYFPRNCVEEIMEEFPNNPFGSSTVWISHKGDTIRQIFIAIKLPILSCGTFWKDNLLELLIKDIKIGVYSDQMISLNVKQTIDKNKDILPNELLFYNFIEPQTKYLLQSI